MQTSSETPHRVQLSKSFSMSDDEKEEEEEPPRNESLSILAEIHAAPAEENRGEKEKPSNNKGEKEKPRKVCTPAEDPIQVII